MTVDSPATSVLLTRENGLNPLKAYDFEVRARSTDDCEGEWSSISERLKGNSHSGTLSLFFKFSSVVLRTS